MPIKFVGSNAISDGGIRRWGEGARGCGSGRYRRPGRGLDAGGGMNRNSGDVNRNVGDSRPQ